MLPPLLTDRTGSCCQERLFGATGHAAHWLKAPRKLTCLLLLLLSFLSLGSKVIFLCPVSTVNVESHLQLLRAWEGARTNLLCFLARCHREAVFVEAFSKGKAVGAGCFPYVRDTERAS